MKPDCGTPIKEPAVFQGGRLGRAVAGHMRRTGRRGEDGQAITEFAMILPLFAILVVVCVMFGKALYVYIQLTHAANEAARLAAVDFPFASGSTLCAALKNANIPMPKGTTITFTYPGASPVQGAGQPVTVDASTGGSWVPIINVGTLHATATMRLEQATTGNAVFTTTCTAT
jgi:Flp pilus assembly protein TadG